MVAVVLLAFVLDVGVVSHLQHAVAQQQLYNTLRAQLAEGVLPVSEGNVDDILLADGVPVAYLEIPEIGLREVIVEGSDSGTLMSGPGHRRDTVLPGQEGFSVILGRAAAFGGPFSRIQELPPGSEFTVVTGQGEQTFRTIGVRYAGDPTPPAVQPGESRLVLQTARGVSFLPSGVMYLDAELVGDAQARGARQTTVASLPDADLALGVDTSTVWALVFALQFLIAVELAAVLTRPRIGPRKAWIVFAPLITLGGLWVATQLVLLLPNLL
ncbi:sortase [Protaetiibacter larvae]|uniref:Sortase n=2 Tax=Protaetiibacter larvae TaxID=2592654 RepID=A0A5C1YCG5_9MICO|nr:sortase [Protaetiibacter larvae]